MAIKFYIPGPLRSQTGGASKVEVAAQVHTLTEALAVLWKVSPGLRDRIVDERGAVRQHVNIFIGDQNIRDCGGLAAAVNDGVEITIVPNVAGGQDSFSR